MEFWLLGVNFGRILSKNSRKFVNFWLKGVNFAENLGKNSRNLNLNSQNLRVKFWRVFGVNFLRNLRFFSKKALKIPLQKTHKTPIAPSLRAFAECEAIHYAPFGAFFERKIHAKNRALQGYGLLRLFQSLAMTSEKISRNPQNVVA